MTLYVVITRDRDGGCRVSLRDGLARTRPAMQSAKEPDRAHARRAAERLFGSLAWRTPAECGLDQGYVLDVAVVEAAPGVW